MTEETYQSEPNKEKGGNGISLERMVNRPTYSYEEAVKKSTEYFGGDNLIGKMVVDKYLLKDSSGNIYELTPEDMHRRLAKEFARVENKYANPLSEEKIFSLFDRFKYLVPQGSPQDGIGNDFQTVSLSNCFVIGNESDSYGGIIRTDEEQVQLMKRRGGVGHDLSHLRPKGSSVANSALNSTGMATFMNRYSESTREVAQDGRRGALMLSASIRHPDAVDFIDAKMTPGKVTGANVSVRIDDEFMRAVVNDEMYIQQFPIDSKTTSVKKEIKARDLWKKIVHNAWASAEPGILFWDTIIRESVPDCYADEGFKTVSTNPCGEIPLCVYDSCRLLAMNLYSYIDDPFTKDAKFNHSLFKEHARYGQRLMDDLIDLELEKIEKILGKINSDPENQNIKSVERELWEKIKEKAVQGRRTGLGVTGEGDMLAALGMRYGSDEAIDFSANVVHKTLALEAYRSSVNMAKERGAFPIYNTSKEENNPFIGRIRDADPELYADMAKNGRRNIAMLTIAPTGSVSLETQTTSGLENAFSISYMRKRKINPSDKNAHIDSRDEVGDVWEHYNVLHDKFVVWAKIKGYNVEKIKKIAEESFRDKGKVEELEAIIKESPYYNARAMDVDWVSKVKLQGAVQKWVDHSISVTVNLPEDISEEMVGKVYEEAWREGCKGVTVYRAGSREGVLISNNGKKEIGRKELSDLVVEQLNRQRPENVAGRTEKVKTPFEHSVLVTLNYEKGENGEIIAPYESFVVIGKGGGDLPAIAEGYGRLISTSLKAGVPIEHLVSQLEGIGGESQTGFGDNKIKSLPDAVARAIRIANEKELKYSGIKNGKNGLNGKGKKTSGNFCPECEHLLKHEEGCEKCTSCDYSRC